MRSLTKGACVCMFEKQLCEMYPNGGKLDYWTAQLMWSEFIDDLCRRGRITLKQYESWTNPMKYGKPVIIRVKRNVPALSL